MDNTKKKSIDFRPFHFHNYWLLTNWHLSRSVSLNPHDQTMMGWWSGAEETTPTHFCAAAIGECKDPKRNLRGKKSFWNRGKRRNYTDIYYYTETHIHIYRKDGNLRITK